MEIFDAFVAALALPPGAMVQSRIPKKMLAEQGAPTAADRRAIQDGIDELRWIASIKPTTVAIPAFKDAERDVSEIAIIGAILRPVARTARLVELMHRAIPYPVLLVTIIEQRVAVSVAPKRAAQNEAGKWVIDAVTVISPFDVVTASRVEREFLESLALVHQPSRDLSTVYAGWTARIEALNAARLTDAFQVVDEAGLVAARRDALEVHTRLAREAKQLRALAKKANQISRRVELNGQIKAIEAEMDRCKLLLRGAIA